MLFASEVFVEQYNVEDVNSLLIALSSNREMLVQEGYTEVPIILTLVFPPQDPKPYLEMGFEWRRTRYASERLSILV